MEFDMDVFWIRSWQQLGGNEGNDNLYYGSIQLRDFDPPGRQRPGARDKKDQKGEEMKGKLRRRPQVERGDETLSAFLQGKQNGENNAVFIMLRHSRCLSTFFIILFALI